MSSKKTLVRNFFNMSKTYSRVTRMRPPTKPGITPVAGDSGIRRRFIHKRALFWPEMAPKGGTLMEKLKEMSLSKDRIRLDEMLPPPPQQENTSPGIDQAVTMEDVKKLMRAAEMEMVKTRLREIGQNWVSYSEFIRVCGENNSDPEQGDRVAKMLEEGGDIIVLGNFVCLRPKELTNAVAGLIPTHEPTGDSATKQEFEQLEVIKLDIDKKAEKMAKRELYTGLGLVIAPTIGCFRLTFWELSWDVMEPICYYVSTAYFMAGYAFFLRTSKEPTFGGFFKSRFDKKQKQLIKSFDFDINRFNKLQKIHRPELTDSAAPS